ncbi:unnamed protein product, partial [Vitis vinifera]
MGLKGFVEGGIASIVAGCSTHPLDLIKVRMQLQGESHIVQAEGVSALFSGVSATVLRQTLYSTTRMGLYDVLKQKWSDPDSGNMPLRRNYQGVIDAITRMSKQEGIASLWRGSALTVNRAMIVTASQLASYDQIKETILEKGPGTAPPYSGALDCAMKTVRAEGPMALYKGFIPTISRQGPFTVVLFVTLEQVRKILKDF